MLQMNAQKQNVTIRVQGGEAPVFADKQLMEELIYNLCDNAIRYNKKDGTVTVTTGIENGHTFLSVKAPESVSLRNIKSVYLNDSTAWIRAARRRREEPVWDLRS